MGEEPEIFHNRWCATRLCFEPTTIQRSSTMGGTTMTEIGHAGFDLGDNLCNLADLRFADDILLFANSGPEVAEIWEFCESSGKSRFVTEYRKKRSY